MTKTALLAFVLGCALAACQTSNTPAKGGTVRGVDARDSGQTVGSKSRTSTRYANDYGDEYEGVTCDAFSEGLAWCDDDYTIAYCSLGQWWLLDCWDVGEDFCGDDGYTVDCYSY